MEQSWIPNFFLKISPVLGSKLQPTGPHLVPIFPVFSSISSLHLYHGSQLVLGGNASRGIQWGKESLPFLFQIHFYPFLSQHKHSGMNTTMFCGKKRKPFCSPSSAGNWKVWDSRVGVPWVPVFLLSLDIGLRDYSVSTWVWSMDSIEQHVSVYFLLVKKKESK